MPTGVTEDGTRAAVSPLDLLRTAATPRYLYVADAGSRGVDILQYGSWTNLGEITNGIGLPVDNWVDKKGNLYVANAVPPSVTEYDSSGRLIFRYSKGMVDARGVTTDDHEIVYEADQAGTVSEYPPENKTPAITCTIPGASEGLGGIALDKRGDVFVDYLVGSGGNIIEYRHGLIASNCNGRVLSVTLNLPIGMAIDQQNNLVVCDYGGPAVDVIAPPYSSITERLGKGWNGPQTVSIDQAGTQAYVSDTIAKNVRVVTYPGGTTVTTLGAKEGLSEPYSAVDSKNYVP